MTIDIEPVELDGQHWINVIIGGQEMKPRGPFASAGEAEFMAEHMRRIGRALTSGGDNRG